MPRQSKKAHVTLPTRAESQLIVDNLIVDAAIANPELKVVLKQIPVLDTATRALQVAAPFDFVQGRRRKTVPSALMIEFMELQQRLAGLGKAHTKQLNEEQQAAFVAEQLPAMKAMFAVMQRLINATIVEWNLHEYARVDGLAYSQAGHITLDDVMQMPDELRSAVIQAVMAGDKKGEADQKKG